MTATNLLCRADARLHPNGARAARTQTQLGERIGVDKMTAARWEWGKMAPERVGGGGVGQDAPDAGPRGVVIAA